MKKLIIFSIFSLIGILLFIGVFWQVGFRGIIESLALLSLWKLTVIGSLIILSVLLSIARWKVILEAQGHASVPFRKLIVAYTVGRSISYLTPCVYVGGEPLRAYILKEEAKVPWDKGLASIILDKAIDLSISLIFFIIGIVYLLSQFSLPLPIVFVLIFFAFLCLFASYIFYSRFANGKGLLMFLFRAFHLDRIKEVNRFQGTVEEIEKNISQFFRHHRWSFGGALLLSLLSEFLLLGAYWFIIVFLGKEIVMIEVISLMALTVFIYFFPIPGSLGTHEISQALIFSFFGFGAHIGIAFSLIVRFFNLLIAGIGLIFLLHFEIKVLGRKAIDLISRFLNGG